MIRVNKLECIGCSICQEVCPVPGAIQLAFIEVGEYITWDDILFRENSCILCGLCIQWCPTNAIYDDTETIYGGLENSDTNTWDSSGGGDNGDNDSEAADTSLGYSVIDEFEIRLNQDQVCFYEIDPTTNAIFTGTSLAAAAKSSGHLLVDLLKESTPMMTSIGRYVTGVGAVSSTLQFYVGVKDGELDTVDVLNGLAAFSGYVALFPPATLIAGSISVALTITATFVDVCNN